jgi:carboxyl-terminal processing protease
MAGCQTPRVTSPDSADADPAGHPATEPPPLALETFDAAWQLIHDTHFDTNFNGVDWLSLRDELRPLVARAATWTEVDGIIQEMIGRLGQSHFTLLPGDLPGIEPEPFDESTTTQATGGASLPPPVRETRGDQSGHPGFEVRPAGEHWLVTWIDPHSPAQRAAIEPGWIVSAIDEEPVSELASLPGELDSSHTVMLAWSALRSHLDGPVGSRVTIQFLDASDQPRTFQLQRAEERGDPVKLGNLPPIPTFFESSFLHSDAGSTIGFIRFNAWMLPAVGDFDRAIDRFRTADGIVIDLRGNVGGIGGMVMGVAGHFFEEPVRLGTLKTRTGELHFVANPRTVNPAGERVSPYDGPVALLTDPLSASTSEIFAAGMQTHGRVRVFGQATPGAALPALFSRLPNGSLLMHAIADFVTPDGTRIEGRGVLPDEPVPLRREDLLAGRDQPLIQAIQWIDRQARDPIPEKIAVDESAILQ